MVRNAHKSLKRRAKKSSYLTRKGKYFHGRFYSADSIECGCRECRRGELRLDSDDEEQERVSEYNDGGYLALEIGTILCDRYQVIRKLGWGVFSTVWLCWDLRTTEFVALKIVKDLECDRVVGVGEAAVLRSIQEAGGVCEPAMSRIVGLKNSFELPGQNGIHLCMVFEVLGKNLLSLVDYERKKGISTKNVKAIVRQVLEGLEFLHDRCHIVHTDIKPENVLLRVDEDYVRGLAQDVVDRVWSGRGLGASMMCANMSRGPRNLHRRLVNLKSWLEDWDPTLSGGDSGWIFRPDTFRTHDRFSDVPSRVKVKVADLGNAVPLDYDVNCTIQTEPYRAPEVILGAGFGCSADIWSVACTTFELATGRILFEPTKSENASRTENHLACIMQVLGPMPHRLRLRGRYSYRYFTKYGSLKHLGRVKKIGLKEILMNECRFGKRQAGELANFLEPMLRVDPRKRLTAADCLLHPWLQRRRPSSSTTVTSEDSLDCVA